MTILSDVNRVDYIGNGAASIYPYTFKILSKTDMRVTQRDTDDVEETLTVDVDYTVSGIGSAEGGSITLTAGNLPSGYALTIRRQRPLTQETDIRNQGDFYPEVHEDAFDHLMMVDQAQQTEIDRSMKLPETVTGVSATLPIPRAARYLRWNAAGTALEGVEVLDTTPNPMTTKGDLLVQQAGGNARLGIGVDGDILVADAASDGGMKWDGRFAAEHETDGKHKYVNGVNLLEFDADPTGGSSSINALIDALATGKKIYAPEGVYDLTGISEPIVIPDGIEFFGDGRTKTIFRVPTDYDDFVFKVQGGGDTDSSLRRGFLHDFGIDGQDGEAGACGILVDWAYIWTFARIYVYNMNHANSIGFHVKDSFNIYMKSCQAKLGGAVAGRFGTGIKLSSTNPDGQNVTQITLFDCLSQFNTTGILTAFATGADGLLIKQCGIGDNDTGIDFQTGTLYNVEISLNHIEKCTTGIKGVATLRGLEIENNNFWNDTTAIDLNGASEATFAKNIFNGTAGARTTLAATNCSRIKWENNNVVFGTAYSGMSLTNTIVNFEPSTKEEVVLSGNAATPVLQNNREYYVFENAASTNVGNFSGQQTGQTIQLRFNDSYTRVYESANIKLKEGGVYGAGSILSLYTPDGSTFYEVFRRIPRETVIPTDAGSIFKDFYHSVGDVRYNSAPAAEGKVGWICTTGGTPGTWKTWGAIDA